MNFYFLFYQLMETAGRMEKGAWYLAAHSLRLSPKDGQANRVLLEESGKKFGDIRKLMFSKSHISKVQLRRTAVIFQILEIAHQRVLNLAGISFPGEGKSIEAIWWFLRQAQRDYQTIRSALSERMGSTVLVALPDTDVERKVSVILQKESELREEMIKQLERGIEIFDEERELTDQLALIRKNLIESRRHMKQLVTARAEEADRTLLSVGDSVLSAGSVNA
jgi:hypothetical protein